MVMSRLCLQLQALRIVATLYMSDVQIHRI